jgi:glycosyl transferase family 4/glycosyl transferase family 1
VTTWHVITGEYPPQTGGVGDYTRQIACGLAAAGDAVHVWAPPCRQAEGRDPGVDVHRLPDWFGARSLWQLDRALADGPDRRRILVQYVPQAFGAKGANVPFCLWLRSRRREPTWVMFHEVMFMAHGEGNLPHQALAMAHRVMARLVAGAADHAFVSIPGWKPMIEPLLPAGAGITWLPVPSAIPRVPDTASTSAIRSRYAAARTLVGHFGTYGHGIRSLLERTVRGLVDQTDCNVLLLGANGERVCVDLTTTYPALAGRVFATGRLSPDAVSSHVAACDVMMQPYPDGVSTRRTSAMVALAHARPLVTTTGWLTEGLWAESGAAVLAPVGDVRGLAFAAATTLADPAGRQAIARRGAALYAARFDVRHVIATLRGEIASSGDSRELACAFS